MSVGPTPRFLASVADPDEAEVAHAAGADILDLKDPRAGSLGAWALERLRWAVPRLEHCRPLSAVTGDLPTRPELVVPAAEAVAATGVDFVKVGFFADGEPYAVIEVLAPLARRVRIVAVLMADQGLDLDLLPALGSAGFSGAMLDTAGKATGGLLTHRTLPELRAFLDAARANGLMTGLAGSLTMTDIPALTLLSPDYLGFRGALCRDGRTGSLDEAACRAVRQALDDCARRAAAMAGAQPSRSAA